MTWAAPAFETVLVALVLPCTVEVLRLPTGAELFAAAAAVVRPNQANALRHGLLRAIEERPVLEDFTVGRGPVLADLPCNLRMYCHIKSLRI